MVMYQSTQVSNGDVPKNTNGIGDVPKYTNE